jgi:hypothetical protein
MILDLSDEETNALVRLLKATIDDDRYPLSPADHDVEGDPRERPAGAGT